MALQSNLNIVAHSVDVTGRNSTYFHLLPISADKIEFMTNQKLIRTKELGSYIKDTRIHAK